MSYLHLSDEDKITQAIKFVAIAQPLPPVLATWLKEQSLYELIVIPGDAFESTSV